MNLLKTFCSAILVLCIVSSCKKENDPPATPSGPSLKFIFKFDSTQARLNNIGQPEGVDAGNAAQSPEFNIMSAHYIELTQNMLTPLGGGAVLYRAPETSTGGSNAIDFKQSAFAGNNEVFFSMPLSTLAAGTYSWLRVSLAYQNYDIRFNAGGQNLTGTIASFIGFNTYISDYKVKDSTVNVNANRTQGYWAFETGASGFGFLTSGQAPPGATTVPNPIFTTSPIPQGSCVVTGEFADPLVINGNETSDITVVVSLSTNKSFEWTDPDGNGMFDPLAGDAVVDMGIRGLKPYRQ